jgi:hypothetical protein
MKSFEQFLWFLAVFFSMWCGYQLGWLKAMVEQVK